MTDDTERIRKLAREGKIEFAADDRIKYLGRQYVDQILDALDFPEAFVTDESTVADFMFGFWKEDELTPDGQEYLQKVSEKLGIEVTANDYIWEIAKRLSK